MDVCQLMLQCNEYPPVPILTVRRAVLDVGSFGRRGAAVDEAFNSGLVLILLKFRPIG